MTRYLLVAQTVAKPGVLTKFHELLRSAKIPVPRLNLASSLWQKQVITLLWKLKLALFQSLNQVISREATLHSGGNG